MARLSNARALPQHKGSLRHAAMPIEAGERQNLIVWLFGDGGEARAGALSGCCFAAQLNKQLNHFMLGFLS